MAQASNIVLPDASVSPVNHTFIPLFQGANGEVTFEDQSGSSPVAYWKVTASLRRGNVGTTPGSTADKVARAILKVYIPKAETLGTNDAGVTPPDRVAYTLAYKIEATLNERSIKLERQHARKITVGLLGNAQIVALLEDLIPLSA